MDRRTILLWRNRQKFIAGCACILAGLFVQRTYSHQASEPVDLVCDQIPADMGEPSPPLPDTHYLLTHSHGWFDRAHFNTGQPGQVLTDVQTAVANGGGVIVIDQGVHDDVMGYTAVYYVSGHVNEADTTAVALGIYLDWSMRFELWQAEPPHGLIAPLTPFAVEDLPSQYLGFFAQAHHMPIEEVFACYLGSVSGSEEGPPSFAIARDRMVADGWAGIVRLQNKTFRPMVKTNESWQYVNWPKPMQMTSIATSQSTWQFLSETTWYWGEDIEDPLRTHVDHGRLQNP